MKHKEIIDQIMFEDRCGTNDTLQMLFDDKWKNKKTSLWTFNEGQLFEVREEGG